jgi:ABC-type glycerol-3-phosphate transport system substrate-binding protein
VVWLPAWTGYATENSAGAVLQEAVLRFEQRNPGVQLEVQIKAEAGSAGLYNYLRAAQVAAPSILPDVVLINTQQLWSLYEGGLVAPLSDSEWPTAPDARFFRAGEQAVVYREQRLGVPFALDVIHLAYSPAVTSTPPTDWAALLAGTQPLIFPAGEGDTAHVGATLLHYVGSGGTLLEDGRVENAAALDAYFAFLLEAQAAGVIPLTVLEQPDFTSTWRSFVSQPDQLALTRVNLFLASLSSAEPFGYAPAPTRLGQPQTVADTWAFALLTVDPTQRQLALALLQEWLTPSVQGPWSQYAARMPSQPAALEEWIQAADYRRFLLRLLETAVAPPNGRAFADFARRLHASQAGLLRGELTLEAARSAFAMTE